MKSKIEIVYELHGYTLNKHIASLTKGKRGKIVKNKQKYWDIFFHSLQRATNLLLHGNFTQIVHLLL